MALAAVAMMDNRKRPLEASGMANGPSDDSPAKRLQLNPPSIASQPERRSPSQNLILKSEGGDDDAEEENPAYKGLEVSMPPAHGSARWIHPGLTPPFICRQTYRKEAIFRQMRESKRDFIRADRKIKTLQQSLAEVEERTGAFNHFWDLVSSSSC